MTLVRELITEPAGGRPAEPWEVTWTLVRENNRPLTGMVAVPGGVDRTVKASQSFPVPAALNGTPVALTVELPATSSIVPAGSRWLRTAPGLDPITVDVPDVAGPVDAYDHLADPPGALMPAATDARFAVVDAELDALLAQAAANPDVLIVGAITRDANGAATSAGVVWPDGTTGAYTATVLNATHLGAVDAYTVTYAGTPVLTYTQPAVTRDANGAVTNRPGMVVT
jgi:hypothetical protein